MALRSDCRSCESCGAAKSAAATMTNAMTDLCFITPPAFYLMPTGETPYRFRQLLPRCSTRKTPPAGVS